MDAHDSCLRGMVWTARRMDGWKEMMVVYVVAESGIDDFLDNLGQEDDI